RRLVAWPNARQQAAFETPRVLTQTQEAILVQRLEREMEELGFRERQIFEATHAVGLYGELSRDWFTLQTTLRFDEKETGGYVQRAHRFLEECRRAGVAVPSRTNIDRQHLDVLRRKVLTKSQALTNKMTGGYGLLLVAMAIKTYLLWPLATSLLQPNLGSGVTITKSAVGAVLAVALSFALTFIARFTVMMLVGLYPGERFKDHRNTGQLFSRGLTKAFAWFGGVSFLLCLICFALVDFANFTARGHEMVSPLPSVGGLSLLFLGIVVCFEVFWAYKTLRLQNEPDFTTTEELSEAYLTAVDRHEDDVALARARTMALDAQNTVQSFMESLDGITKGARNAARRRNFSMRILRRFATEGRRSDPFRWW
ncbi:MAG: hypothetical protein ABUL72_04990, partial [Armatimonadota bacterium]